MPAPDPDDLLAECFADALIRRLAAAPENADLRRRLLRAAGLPVAYETRPTLPGTQERVAHSLGISRSTLRKIERRALLKLRHQLTTTAQAS